MKCVKTAICVIGVVLAALTSGILRAADASACPEGWAPGPDADWKVFWDDALAEAQQTGKKLFVLACGSDWCGWCVRLKDDVLLTPTFKAFAQKNLVLLYLDFPNKPLPDDQKLHNEKMGGVLGLGDCMPCAAVFDADSRRRGVIPGYFKTPEEYVARIEETFSQPGEMPKDGVPPDIFKSGYSATSREDPKKPLVLPPGRCGSGCCGNGKGKGKCAEQETPVVVPGEGGSDEGDDAEWCYETFFNRGRRCAKIVSADEKYAGSLAIPSSLDNHPVRKIDIRAFYRCTGLRSIKIPSSVTCIGKSAFSRCGGLRTVTIASGLTQIGDYAFERCSSLRSVRIPSSVTSFGYHAFADCPLVDTVYVSRGDAARVKVKLARSGLTVGKLRFVEVDCD